MYAIIKILLPADLPRVMKLEQSIPDSFAWQSATKEEQLPIINADNTYGIFENNVLIGKVGFINDSGKEWHVDGLILDSKFRNKGYGKKLFSYALESFIKKVHPDKISLYVYPQNSAAITLYLRNGFIIKEWISDKYGPGKHRLKMVKNIFE